MQKVECGKNVAKAPWSATLKMLHQHAFFNLSQLKHSSRRMHYKIYSDEVFFTTRVLYNTRFMTDANSALLKIVGLTMGCPLDALKNGVSL